MRLGLAFVFAYAAISAFQKPDAWLYFVPHFVTTFVPATLFLKLFGVLQLMIAAALVVGKYVRWAALLAALSLAGLLVFNLTSGKLLITFRDVGLTFMAAALYFLAMPKKR